MTLAERPWKILYIDDDPGIARLVQIQLERLGFQVTTALDGDQGTSLAHGQQFDAIALDHFMPGRDGLEVLESLRLLPNPPPVIFVTGAEEPRIAVTALKSGAADYVVKDVHGSFIELLAASINQEIKRAGLQRAKEAAEREVRESRDRLERLLEQQRVLLREVNHRVANSLQLISSLIDLQARKLHDESARALLRQAAERVEAVTLVHRRLYTGQDVAFVDMDSYLSGLLEELSRSLGTGDGRVCIEFALQPLRMDTDRAVALGLVVNELVVNAVKYAYPDCTAGAVRVTLDADEAALIRLTVEDDGVGFDAEQTPKGSGLGSLIVRSMAQTLRAEIDSRSGAEGTRLCLTMPAVV
jgi:two-component sensor histidine kinase/CheY-like chemotaxis protein